jgi:hypothetical protein
MKKNNPEYNDSVVGSPPAVRQKVWKGPYWYGIASAAPWCAGGFFLFVGLVALAEKRDAQYAPLLFITAVCFFLTSIPLRKWGKTVLSLGIDRNRNRVWIERKGTIVYQDHADLIQTFGIQGFVYTKVNPTWGVNPSQPFLFKNYKWLLTYKRIDNDYFWEFKGVRFATKRDALHVAEKANQLLSLPQRPRNP